MTQHKRRRPAADAPDKPQSPTELTKPTWRYSLRKAIGEFGTDQCTDLAAGLTYHSVLAVFPALLAVVSVLGLVGEGQRTVDTLLQILQQVGSTQVVQLLKSPIEALVRSPAAPVTFTVGLLGALWSASGYVAAFGRAMNRIYDVREGRPFWKFRATMMLVTIGTVVLLVVGLLALVAAPAVRRFGDVFGLGDVATTVLSVLQWPVLAAVAVIVVAVLYYWTPNVQQPKYRWISGGAILALLVAAAASVGFAFYASLGGVIVFLLWIWIVNNVLLLGAEFDAELERGRELQAGIHAEEDIQLPYRDTAKIDKQNVQHANDVLTGVRIRETAGRHD
jgi:membrane protein